eukprot:11778697-Prorocentrum_lima.AAC.1
MATPQRSSWAPTTWASVFGLLEDYYLPPMFLTASHWHQRPIPAQCPRDAQYGHRAERIVEASNP